MATTRHRHLESGPGRTCAVFAIALSSIVVSALPALAQAQGPVAGYGQAGSVTIQATVKSIDPATRHVILIGPEGNAFTVKVSRLARNLGQVRPGDQVRATYYRSTMYVLSSANTPLPPDSDAVAAARAPAGQLPAGAVANRIVVTGLVVGIDLADHSLQLIDPRGGEVHTVMVTDPQRQQQLNQVKVGDKITAYITEALLISVDRI
jgi:hypothetical protein